MMNNNPDLYLEVISEFSHHPTSKVGAFVIDSREHFLLHSANLYTSGFKLGEDEPRSPYLQHAEQALICKAARLGVPLNKTSMWINWYPCNVCAQAIVSAGISTVHVKRQSYEERKDDSRYNFAAASRILKAGGVEVVWS